MKKIEKGFLEDFNDSLNNQKTFDDIKRQININRFEKKERTKFALQIRHLKFAAIFAAFIAIVIPSSIAIFNPTKSDTNVPNNASTLSSQANNETSSDNDKDGNPQDSGASRPFSYTTRKSGEAIFQETPSYDITSIIFLKSASDKHNLFNDLQAKQIDVMYPNLFELINDAKFDETYFINNTIIICPFVYSTSEHDIDLIDFEVNLPNNSYNVYFKLYSPEEVDYDLRIEFYILEVSGQYMKDLNNPTGRILVINTRDNSNNSAYYGNI